MIDTLLKIRYYNASDSFKKLELEGALPEWFELLSRPEYVNKVVARTACPCCDNQAIPLLGNWLYEDRQLLLLDSTVIYCPQRNSLLLTNNEERTLQRRLDTICSADLVPLASRAVGIGQKISEKLIGEPVLSALQIRGSDEAEFSPDADAIVASRPNIANLNAMPSALALHSNNLPSQMTLKLEPTTHCNFTCEFCYGRHIEQGSLSIDDFHLILDQFPTLKSVELTGEGEPLLNRHIYEMVRKCSERGLWTHLTTNGSLLSQKNCELLLDAGLSSLAISIESLDASQFARIRPGGKLEKVLNGIHNIKTAKKKTAKQLESKLWVTVLRETLPEIEKIEAFARAAQVDCVEYQTLNSMSSYMRFYGQSLRKNILKVAEMESMINAPDTKPMLRSVLRSLVESYRGKRCDVFMNTTMVYWQGSVTPCCLLKTPHFVELGNLTGETIQEVWNKTEFVFFRFALQHGIVLKSCEGCSFLAGSQLASHS